MNAGKNRSSSNATKAQAQTKRAPALPTRAPALQKAKAKDKEDQAMPALQRSKAMDKEDRSASLRALEQVALDAITLGKSNCPKPTIGTNRVCPLCTRLHVALLSLCACV